VNKYAVVKPTGHILFFWSAGGDGAFVEQASKETFYIRYLSRRKSHVDILRVERGSLLKGIEIERLA
jgi:hypothetical protein